MRRTIASIFLLAVGCGIPEPPTPLTVRPSDLVKAYRDSPSVADTAYTGVIIRLNVANAERDVLPDRLVWRLFANTTTEPVLIFVFDGQVPDPSPDLVIIGRCRGRTHDGKARELPGFVFFVRVEGCRVGK